MTMSDKMTPMPFRQLLAWILEEKKKKVRVTEGNLHKYQRNQKSKSHWINLITKGHSTIKFMKAQRFQ